MSEESSDENDAPDGSSSSSGSESGSESSSSSSESGSKSGESSSEESSAGKCGKKKGCGDPVEQAYLEKHSPPPISLPALPKVDPDGDMANTCPCAKKGESSESGSGSSSSSGSSTSTSGSASGSSASSASSSSDDCPCAEGYDAVAGDLKKMRKITEQIAGVMGKIDQETQWMDKAEHAFGVLEREIRQVQETKDDLKSDVDILRKKKLDLKKKMTADAVARDLRQASDKFKNVAVKSAIAEDSGEELADAEKKLSKKVKILEDRLKQATEWLDDIKKLPPA